MKFLIWLLRVCVFVALFGLAVKNSALVELRFFFSGAWQAPLSLIILAAFFVGAVVGLTATVTTLFRQGRELRHLHTRLRSDTEGKSRQ